ncbi:hypothetical protein BCV69DRAFT_280847 [Microstroma glucosiphilum]|uniref:Uncharacterized protein n=1 Tax=Pseudomicrostroma glucosiphilum TaxID=1684307 RepID=A0A316UDC1_9BASI|nr:hypothetical protein BCV69DRAFT_280847 [Pseudomicrostroma glucosiphilum]PWN23237.1 hypothetical protein BCV69DRAFT_280847 [Pseudomicrostroma glucosiphilum]
MIIRLSSSSTGHAASTTFTFCVPRALLACQPPRPCPRSRLQPAWSPPLTTSRGLTTHALGSLYETHCLASLERLLPGLTLQQVGGAGDRGVDLRGWIQPGDLDAAAAATASSSPSHSRPVSSAEAVHRVGERRVRVVVQCKATNRLKEKKLGPVILRELEGVMGRITRNLRNGEDEQEDQVMTDGEEARGTGEAASERQISPQPTGSLPAASTATSILAILCSSSGFSKQTMLQATNQVEGNVMLVHLPLPEEISRRIALEGLTIGDDPQASQSREDLVSASTSATASQAFPSPPPPSSMPSAEDAQKAADVMCPISILLSSRLRSATSGSGGRGNERQRDPLAGRFSVGTRRSLEEGGGEAPFLLWDGAEIVG